MPEKRKCQKPENCTDLTGEIKLANFFCFMPKTPEASEQWWATSFHLDQNDHAYFCLCSTLISTLKHISHHVSLWRKKNCSWKTQKTVITVKVLPFSTCNSFYGFSPYKLHMHTSWNKSQTVQPKPAPPLRTVKTQPHTTLYLQNKEIYCETLPLNTSSTYHSYYIKTSDVQKQALPQEGHPSQLQRKSKRHETPGWLHLCCRSNSEAINVYTHFYVMCKLTSQSCFHFQNTNHYKHKCLG